MITIDDFKKLEIKIGRVVSAEAVPESEKLIKLIFDIGGEERQIIAGILKSYPDPNALVGKQMPVLLNLEPRKLMGLESQGMVLAANAEGSPVVLFPERSVPPGSEVR